MPEHYQTLSQSPRVRGTFEIKLTASPSPGDMRNLDANADLVKATRRFLISRTIDPVWTDTRVSCDLPGLLKYLSGA